MSTPTDTLREALHTAHAAGPDLRIAAEAILRSARRRQQRHRALAGSGLAAALALVVAGTLALTPSSIRDVQSITTVDGGSVLLGGVRLRPVVEHAPMHVGDSVTIAGDRYTLRRNTGSGQGASFCTNAHRSPPTVNCLSSRYQGTIKAVDGGGVSPTVPGDDVPMVFIGFTTLRPTYGLMYNRADVSTLHVARVGSQTLYWGVLRPEHRTQLRAGHRVQYTANTMSLRMASTDQSGHITDSICLPQDLSAHCSAGRPTR